MNLRRISLAAALAAGLSIAGASQAQEPKKDPPAAAPPAKPAETPAAPKVNPAIQQAADELVKGDLEKAVTILKKAKDADPLLEPPLVILSKMLYSTGKNGQAARQLVERASAEEPGHPDPYILSGQYALNEGRFIDAMLCFETALAKAASPNWPISLQQRFVKSAREGLAQAYSQRNEIYNALGQLKALLESDKKNAVIRFQAARLMFLIGQTEAAFDELKTAFTDDPKNPQVGLPEVNMAKFWEGRPFKKDDEKVEEPKNKATADEWFKKALAAHKDVRAPREYARWLLSQGKIPEADKQLADAKALDDKDNETNALIGVSFRYKKDYAKAEEIFDALNRSDPNNPYYAWNLAIALAESGDETKRKRAVNYAELTAKAQPKSPEAFSVLGWCLFKADRLDEAEQSISQALSLGNNNAPPDTVFYLAKILEKKGKGTEARDRIKQAVESKAAFVYRKEAEALYAELKAKHPETPVSTPDKKDDKPKP